MTARLTYIDPDGQPSHQPGERTRTLDAAARRLKYARRAADAVRRVAALEAELEAARREVLEAVEAAEEYARDVVRHASRSLLDEVTR